MRWIGDFPLVWIVLPSLALVSIRVRVRGMRGREWAWTAWMDRVDGRMTSPGDVDNGEDPKKACVDCVDVAGGGGRRG